MSAFDLDKVEWRYRRHHVLDPDDLSALIAEVRTLRAKVTKLENPGPYACKSCGTDYHPLDEDGYCHKRDCQAARKARTP